MHAAGLRDPGRLVAGLIRRELAREGLPEDTFGRLDPDEVVLARIADRSVLGCMNDMAFLCEVAVNRSAGLAEHRHRGPQPGAAARVDGPRGYIPAGLAAQRVRARH